MTQSTGTPSADTQPNVLFIMTDQQRFDTIGALGDSPVSTPNIDRLVKRGVTMTNAYSTCPVCVPARYTIRTGWEPTRTGIYDNQVPERTHDRLQKDGPFLAQAMRDRGYRSWGVGKFHASPWDAALGYETQLYSEEMYQTPRQREGDDYAEWLRREHPEYSWVEALMGERTEMYYMPQMSPFPAAVTVEAWSTDRAVELMRVPDSRPWFGLVSFIGPHPPFAPPLPYNRAYDPDRMPLPVSGEVKVDHLDQQIPWMNYATFADTVDDNRARTLKARYYGEISYIDECIGRILDEVDSGPDAANTLVCFFSDHGELLGDHHGWQKESFFEASARIPFLVSWPVKLAADAANGDFVCLTDLFGIATSAAGEPDLRQGVDVLGTLTGNGRSRDTLFGYHGRPGTRRFKAMVRQGDHKLIWMANGGTSLLFNVAIDPNEQSPLGDEHAATADRLRGLIESELRSERVDAALDERGLRTFDYEEWTQERIYQFDESRGVVGYSSPTRSS